MVKSSRSRSQSILDELLAQCTSPVILDSVTSLSFSFFLCKQDVIVPTAFGGSKYVCKMIS